MQDKQGWIIGLMSGTSLDGIDAALLRTDGETVKSVGDAVTLTYTPEFRRRIKDLIEEVRGLERIEQIRAAAMDVESELTHWHAEAVNKLMNSAGIKSSDVNLIGFHGQTVAHRPADGLTCQIGDGALLARETGIPVAFDFRSADIAAGGEGAPLTPAYHRALVCDRTEDYPVAVLNIGGVANVTWIGDANRDDKLIAFDTGPGNALIDDFMDKLTGTALDRDGTTALRGRADSDIVAQFIRQTYFSKQIPKSLDRNEFSSFEIPKMTLEDGAATRVALTVAGVREALRWLPEPPRKWWVTGGGRHNRAIIAGLKETLGVPVKPIDDLGFDGDAIEAQAFGFLAARSVAGLPISYPMTTGVTRPMTGGRLAQP